MNRGQNYSGLIDMLAKYENKFKRKMTVPIFTNYISEALKVSQKTANEYIHDLAEKGKIIVEKDGKITRGD